MIDTLSPHRSTDLERLRPGSKVLWVSSTGGHFQQLSMIDQFIQGGMDSVWVTFDTPQTSDFLKNRRSHIVDYVGPRALGPALKAANSVRALLKHENFSACISTGAALAGTVLPIAAWSGIPTYYVESLARSTGPSLTGKLLARVPGVQTICQYSGWSSAKWPFTRSVLDGWQATDKPLPSGPLKILVTLGTIHGYRFDRAIDAVLKLLRPGDKVVWQLGCTPRTDLPGEVFEEVSPNRLSAYARDADVVVAHSGVGSILHQFELGKSPVLAVRDSRYNEHVDDHQQGFADTTAARGLTSLLDLDSPCRDVLERAARRLVKPVSEPVPVYSEV